jgi:cytochrome o ubiquinol oxidase subunit II
MALLIVLLLSVTGSVDVLRPSGLIAERQKNLIVFATLLSLIVVLPVFFLTFYIAIKYRAGNVKAKYQPEFIGSKKLETLWWGVPLVLIIILSVVTYKSSHDLDPRKSIANSKETLNIQVIAMNWKWLFIYPEQNIATVNYVALPVNKPVKFEITADSAMNSFWIPKLGGQIYAMNGMTTNLNLRADEMGKYVGSSANLSGEGFAGMKFETDVKSVEDFDSWIQDVSRSPEDLSIGQYSDLSAPTKNHPVIYYSKVSDDIFATVLRKYIGY